MFRFSIREWLLITALLAIWLGWRMDRRGCDRAHKSSRDHAECLREALRDAKWECDFLLAVLEDPDTPRCATQRGYVDWNLAEKPIP